MADLSLQPKRDEHCPGDALQPPLQSPALYLSRKSCSAQTLPAPTPPLRLSAHFLELLPNPGTNHSMNLGRTAAHRGECESNSSFKDQIPSHRGSRFEKQPSGLRCHPHRTPRLENQHTKKHFRGFPLRPRSREEVHCLLEGGTTRLPLTPRRQNNRACRFFFISS